MYLDTLFGNNAPKFMKYEKKTHAVFEAIYFQPKKNAMKSVKEA